MPEFIKQDEWTVIVARYNFVKGRGLESQDSIGMVELFQVFDDDSVTSGDDCSGSSAINSEKKGSGTGCFVKPYSIAAKCSTPLSHRVVSHSFVGWSLSEMASEHTHLPFDGFHEESWASTISSMLTWVVCLW